MARVIILWLWRESNYQKPLAIMKRRMTLLCHCRLWITLTTTTWHYSNGIPKVCSMLYLQPSNSSCAACKRMSTYERRKEGTTHSPRASTLPKPTSPLLFPLCVGAGHTTNAGVMSLKTWNGGLSTNTWIVTGFCVWGLREASPGHHLAQTVHWRLWSKWNWYIGISASPSSGMVAGLPWLKHCRGILCLVWAQAYKWNGTPHPSPSLFTPAFPDFPWSVQLDIEQRWGKMTVGYCFGHWAQPVLPWCLVRLGALRENQRVIMPLFEGL